MENNNGGVFAPNYYKNFKCIADKCRHSCCVDWEICIDAATYEKYRRLPNVISTVRECDDGVCFALRSDGSCPHLNEKGLCDIIINHGEEYLSEICREHPRFYNFVYGGRVEVGLGLVCEQACRLVLENDCPFTLYKVENMEQADYDGCSFNPLPYRSRIISAIEGEGSFEKKLDGIKAEFSLPRVYTSEQWINRFLSLEILDASWAEDLKSLRGKLLKKDGFSGEYDKYYCRLFTYFVYRHVSVAESEKSLKARLAFAALSAELIRLLFESKAEPSLQALADIARRYSGEIEYSEDNTDELIFTFENRI